MSHNERRLAVIESQFELAPDEMVGTSVDGKPLVVANVNGEYVAFPDVCLHYKVRLSEGTLNNGVVTCRWHQWGYCVESGRVMSEESPYATFTTFNVVAEGRHMYIDTSPRTRTTFEQQQ